LRGGVAPLNGGAGGRNPQIRVLPSLVKLETHKYISFAAPIDTTTYDPYPKLTLFTNFDRNSLFLTDFT
jgi:hypothetical protein